MFGAVTTDRQGQSAHETRVPAKTQRKRETKGNTRERMKMAAKPTLFCGQALPKSVTAKYIQCRNKKSG
ncbi:hypothetical protein AM629_13255 [Photorhabdus heterorhabditis]|uniref:Uncharacterized protein n=1 Tax=Photorhabdus heterorhabditis TaxID=880156 RepID=A0ABR5KAT0_9GAMM|nr:hypothetical protein AM629_13255 [Photorhabdus heterorhabditis]